MATDSGATALTFASDRHPIPLFHVRIGGLGSVAKLQFNHVGKEMVMFFESAGAEPFGR